MARPKKTKEELEEIKEAKLSEETTTKPVKSNGKVNIGGVQFTIK